MAKITWLGDVDQEGTTPPDAFCTWNEIMFPLGKPVDVDNPHMIAKARYNRFFSVDDEPTRERLPTMYDYLPLDEDQIGEHHEPTEAEPPKRKRGRPPKVRDNGDH